MTPVDPPAHEGSPSGNDGPDAADKGGVRHPRDETELRARLEELRALIVSTDRELIRLVGRRRDLVLEVGEVKSRLGLPVLDPAREAEVVRRAAELARELGVDEELTRDVVWRIIASARTIQEGREEWGPPRRRDDPGD